MAKRIDSICDPPHQPSLPSGASDVHLIVPILGYGLRRADDLSRALEARGLSAPGKHTEYVLLKASWGDGVGLALSVGIAAASMYLRLTGHGELLPRL